MRLLRSLRALVMTGVNIIVGIILMRGAKSKKIPRCATQLIATFTSSAETIPQASIQLVAAFTPE